MLSKTSPNELDALMLLDAQALVERGWCQRAVEMNGGVCLLGAINKAASGDAYKCDMDRHFNAYDALERAIGVVSMAEAVEWNNAPERTQAEVVEAFGKAAVLVRGDS